MLLLENFGNASGLKINLQKSHLFGIGMTLAESKRLAALLHCIADALPFCSDEKNT